MFTKLFEQGYEVFDEPLLDSRIVEGLLDIAKGLPYVTLNRNELLTTDSWINDENPESTLEDIPAYTDAVQSLHNQVREYVGLSLPESFVDWGINTARFNRMKSSQLLPQGTGLH